MFACLFIPDFPVQAALLAEPEDSREILRQSSIVILDGPSNLLKVVALNDAARKAGIEIGMTKLQVETCSDALLRKRSADNEDFAQDELIALANNFSPRVESTCPGTAILDLTGMEKLFGPHENIACKILVKARQIGFHLRIAIASNPDTTFYAVQGFAGIKIIARGDEAKELGPLPVSILPATPEILEVFDSWGIHTFKSLAALPSIALAERLGQEGLALQKLAQAKTRRSLVPIEPLPEFVESYEFEDPVETLESLAFVLKRLLQEICDGLASHFLATNELRLTLELEVLQLRSGEQQEYYKHEWKLPVPTQDKNVLFMIVKLDLERNTFSAPIKSLTIEAVPIKSRTVQRNLFAPPSPESEKLEITLARIRGVVGTADEDGISCVGSPKLLNTHHPGTFAVEPFSSNPETKAATATSVISAQSPTIALRMFRPALATRVELDGETPHFVWLWKKYRRVLAASGPWSSSGNWWDSARAWAREEWDVALKTLEGIGYYRIYFDRLKKQWFVEGFFD